jgi:sugar/nucleoside kinase (ribokinase family)
MQDYKVTAFGSARMDIFAKLPGEEVEAECSIDRKKCIIELGYGEKIPLSGIEYWVGGNAANLAVGMKRLGIEAQLVAELGEGINADLAYKQLSDERIGMERVSRTAGVVPGLGIVINYQAERTILSYYSPFRPEFPIGMAPTSWAYLTSMGEGFEGYYGRVLSWVRDNKVKLAFNPGGRQIKKGLDWILPYLRQTEVLLLNREEAARLLSDNVRYSIDDVEKLVRGLFEKGPKIVVLTDGPSGAYAYNGQSILYEPIFDSPVVERTGAGDAFSTGFLSALISGNDIKTALAWGTVNSASVIGQVGAEQGLLKKDQMEEWLGKLRK